jgi:hypothetical protein
VELEIPSRAEVLNRRVVNALLGSQSFPVRVDLKHIPDEIRMSVMEELEDAGYSVYWNGDHPKAGKANQMMVSLGFPSLQEDYWLIFPCDVQ